MKIIYEESFLVSLLQILQFIAKDKKSASVKFKNDLKNKILLLKESPLMCRNSIYIDDKKYHDLVFKGYTTIYKIDEEVIKVLDIFKWEDR